MDIKVSKNKEGYSKMKKILIDMYGNDMDVFNNMNIYTPEWATVLKSPVQSDNGFKAKNVDDWINKLINKLKNVPFVVFLDHVKYDTLHIKRELTVNFD